MDTIEVKGSIRLGQFLKLAGVVEDGATARLAIQSGDVEVNGPTETRRGSHLSDGDIVTVHYPDGETGDIAVKVIA